ncbi:AbrB/MazE/SpoVT family DNA-binding domain-containing protein [bacterium]|nr:AbrB/MazE/SpoVT family DNA-binding domain-containing protein [bacterium]
MTTKIAKWGNSLAVRLSREVAEDFDLEEGSVVEITSDMHEITIRPTKETKKYEFSDLVRVIRPGNVHKETDWSSPRGKEIW